MRFGAKDFGQRLFLYLRLSVWLTLLFAVTYGTTNWLASRRSDLYHLYFDWELGIPFVPWMIYIYLSINVFLTLPVAVLDTAEIRRFAKAFALATLAATFLHLLLPAQLGWSRPANVPGHPIFERFYGVVLPHNLVPSLHITYGTLAAAVIWDRTTVGWLRVVAAIWFALLVLSVLLVHQHHLLDIATGAALGLFCYRWFFTTPASNRSA